MEKEKPSLSAAGVAGFRAIEAEKAESERVIYDPYAYVFTPGGLGWSISKWIITFGLYEKMAPGAESFILLRERYIDDFLGEQLSNGLQQVVILGAGYDTRAYRISGMEKTIVFEVDERATQNRKKTLLVKAVNPVPSFVSFVPVNFNTESLGDALRAAGYSEEAKTIFIWQGVTYFLTNEGVDSTLAFIAEHSGKGSTVIFDYMYNEILRDESRNDVKMIKRAAKISGEAYLFGIDKGQVGDFLYRRGFQDILDKTLEDLKRIYFTGANAERVVPSGIAIASAMAKKGISHLRNSR